MSSPKVVLAYSGGLDTSVAIPWLKERGFEVIALTVHVGQPVDLHAVRKKALASGARRAYIVDAREEFARDYLLPAIAANAIYEGVYPLSTALARPLIGKHLVAVARKEGATHIAHGCTGKGNDQVRFDLSTTALAPELKVIAPAREWGMTRDEEIAYAAAHHVPVTAKKASPYSTDENLWGRSVECGVLEDPALEPPEEVYAWTQSPLTAPDEPEHVRIGFEHGAPTHLNGVRMGPRTIIEQLNRTAGTHGVGRIDHLESRLVGIKSREVYECPAATVLLAAHQALEALVLPRDLLDFKRVGELRYSQLIYDGLWYTPLRTAIDAFVASTQERVTGEVAMKLYKGSSRVSGRTSPYALYRHDLATYSEGDRFNASSAEGFIYVWGLPSRTWAAVGEEKSRPATATVPRQRRTSR
ncbi:MAG: argininosuccinate synthase [Candidatus Thermoplasmatota archaeon]|jgi:argininosuccinate synthase|nr:argininosuccinate synthase [Candidatus Thermoplasmatota archaeon]MCL5983275.1 argininosuccinate synthase [Candidatus Thermoplasmatota archaeon]